MVLSTENPELPGTGQTIALYALHTAKNSALSAFLVRGKGEPWT